MRVWDLPAGYLNRGSLLAEHLELHGLRSILLHGKTGYSRHPETLRWVGCLSGLAQRHEALAAEMRLRGYVDRTPVAELAARCRWPAVFVTAPGEQLALLKAKYRGKLGGRIPLPRNAMELWASHKYSVMARDPEAYRRIGRRAARLDAPAMGALAEELVHLLRAIPDGRRLVNALEHMWGHVAGAATGDERRHAARDLAGLTQAIQQLALRTAEPYLMRSTALSELAVFALPGSPLRSPP